MGRGGLSKLRSLSGVPTFGLGHAGGLTGGGRFHGAGGSRGGGRTNLEVGGLYPGGERSWLRAGGGGAEAAAATAAANTRPGRAVPEPDWAAPQSAGRRRRKPRPCTPTGPSVSGARPLPIKHRPALPVKHRPRPCWPQIRLLLCLSSPAFHPGNPGPLRLGAPQARAGSLPPPVQTQAAPTARDSRSPPRACQALRPRPRALPAPRRPPPKRSGRPPRVRNLGKPHVCWGGASGKAGSHGGVTVRPRGRDLGSDLYVATFQKR